MATYRLVREDEWRRALEAIEGLEKALRESGTVTLPDTQPGLRLTSSSRAKPGDTRSGEKLAQSVIDRVKGGGEKHQPKVFDRQGPKIADFVYILANGSFSVPDVIDLVGQYVELKPDRRKAGGQIRTAIRADARFQQLKDGRYTKV